MSSAVGRLRPVIFVKLAEIERLLSGKAAVQNWESENCLLTGRFAPDSGPPGDIVVNGRC